MFVQDLNEQNSAKCFGVILFAHDLQTKFPWRRPGGTQPPPVPLLLLESPVEVVELLSETIPFSGGGVECL
jgi:hypothetical protein